MDAELVGGSTELDVTTVNPPESELTEGRGGGYGSV